MQSVNTTQPFKIREYKRSKRSRKKKHDTKCCDFDSITFWSVCCKKTYTTSQPTNSPIIDKGLPNDLQVPRGKAPVRLFGKHYVCFYTQSKKKF